MTKRWFYSKTIWSGVAEAIIGGVFQIQEGWDVASPAGIALMVIGTIQVILRLITTDPIGK